MISITLSAPALAHQPFFEEEDIAPDSPWEIHDPTVSTAVYATLESSTDIDYFTFEGEAGQSILLQMTIPQIEGQEEFAPTMALMGPGLPAVELPSQVETPADQGAVLLSPPPGPATTFFEPFSRTSYWERQESRVTLPANARYVVAVWHDSGEVGRYVFVVGDKEELGGDLTFPIKMRSYWTPVGSAPVAAQAFPIAFLILPCGVLPAAIVVVAVWLVLGRRRESGRGRAATSPDPPSDG
jgi:hypothetical protein